MKVILIIILIALVSEFAYIGFTRFGHYEGELKIDDSKTINIDGYVAENIVYDEVTNRYWWIFSDRNDFGIRLASSTNLEKWDIEKECIIGANADSACLKKFGDIWYIYYGKYDTLDPSCSIANIYMTKSSFVNRNYSYPILVLKVGNEEGDWDGLRVSEPDVICVNGAYLLFYMGEDTDKIERVGYAISDNPEGNFVKYRDNPVLVGSSDSENKWNSGKDKAADPFILPIYDGYLIQYTACSKDKKNWTIGWAFTKDFFEFKSMESPILVNRKVISEGAVVRGGIIKIGKKYIMSFSVVDVFCKLSMLEIKQDLMEKSYYEYIN